MRTYKNTIRNMKYLKQFIKGRSIVIWGAGVAGERIKRATEEVGLKVLFFVDGNRKKQNTIFKGVQVINPNCLLAKRKEYYVVISSNYYREIEELVRQYGYMDLEDYRYLYHTHPKADNEIIFKGVPVGIMPTCLLEVGENNEE